MKYEYSFWAMTYGLVTMVEALPIVSIDKVAKSCLQLLARLYACRRFCLSNHQPHDCLLNRLFKRRSKNTSKLRITGLWVGNSPVTGEFLAQMASNAENVSILWRHHGKRSVLVEWVMSSSVEFLVAGLDRYLAYLSEMNECQSSSANHKSMTLYW